MNITYKIESGAPGVRYFVFHGSEMPEENEVAKVAEALGVPKDAMVVGEERIFSQDEETCVYKITKARWRVIRGEVRLGSQSVIYS